MAAILLCAILPSSYAFTSLISVAGVPTVAAYALIPILRLIFTRGQFAHAKWSCGRWSTPFCVIAAVWNIILLAVLLSPYTADITPQNFNFSIVVFAAVVRPALALWNVADV